ncbi:hypothetical protein thsrh120_52770 [Rhizobium sp. No.120]
MHLADLPVDDQTEAPAQNENYLHFPVPVVWYVGVAMYKGSAVGLAEWTVIFESTTAPLAPVVLTKIGDVHVLLPTFKSTKYQKLIYIQNKFRG